MEFNGITPMYFALTDGLDDVRAKEKTTKLLMHHSQDMSCRKNGRTKCEADRK